VISKVYRAHLLISNEKLLEIRPEDEFERMNHRHHECGQQVSDNVPQNIGNAREAICMLHCKKQKTLRKEREDIESLKHKGLRLQFF